MKQKQYYFILMVIIGTLSISVSSYAHNRVVNTYLNNVADVTITGKVTSESGEGLPGVNIAAKGTTRGTSSDATGNYSITVPENTTLIFTFIGYVSQEIAVGNRSVIDVSLLPDVKTLSEVVVVGYGTQERKDVTGSIGSVDVKTIRDVPIQTADQALQGRIAGVDVQSNSGLPGTGVKINIRGVGTTNSTEPLYVIDGYYPGNINSLNPNDIASIDVLKDASASAIYGVLGANGVVIITTKRAKSGKPTVTLDSYWGQQTPRHYLDLLGNRDFATVSNNAKDNNTIDNNFNNFLSGKPGNIVPVGSERVPSLTDLNNLPRYDSTNGTGDQKGKEINTDWQRQVYRTAMTRNHNLTVSAGNDNSRILLSLGYLNQDGILKGTGFERMSLRLNGDVKFNKLTFGTNVYFAQEKRLDNNGGRQGGSTTSLTKASPTLAVYNYDPSYTFGFNGNERARDGQDAGNPLRDLIINNHQLTNYLGIASIFAEYEIIPGLKYKLNLGGDMNIGHRSNYDPVYKSSSSDYRPLAQLYENNDRSFGLLAENTLNYEKTFGKHKFNVLVGYVARQGLYSGFSATKNTFPVGDLIRVASAGKNALAYEGSSYNSSQLGILGRINYEFDKRFYVTANIRRDGSSRFGKDYLYGTFPSASVGWRLSQEEFVKNISFISNLFLRAGWGRIGNQDIGDYRYRAVINSYPVYPFGNGSSLSTGGTLTDAANSKIRWETTTSSNIGLDLSILNNKVNFTVDYFSKTTSDILLTTPIPVSTGYDGPPTTNVGKINNKGVEIATTYQDKSGDLTWALGGNMTFIRNKVVEVIGDKSFIPGGFDGSSGGNRSITRTEAGHSVGEFYGLVVEKVLQNNTEIYYNDAKDGNSGSTYGGAVLKPGDIKFKDLNKDGKIDAANDRAYIGSPFPNFSYGFYGRAGYKGLELQIQFQGVQGSQIFNLARYWTEGMQRNFNYDNHTLNRYISENTPGNGVVPRANAADANNTQISNRYIENGSYLRLKNLTLAYNFNQLFLNKLHSVSTLRLYVTGSNLLTFTKYNGYDPEVGASYADVNNYNGTSNLNRNIDNASYPIPKTFLVGIQVGF